jgi:hypothetical protein
LAGPEPWPMLMLTLLGGGAIQPALGLARELQPAERGCGSWRRPGSPGGSPRPPRAGRPPIDQGTDRADADSADADRPTSLEVGCGTDRVAPATARGGNATYRFVADDGSQPWGAMWGASIHRHSASQGDLERSDYISDLLRSNFGRRSAMVSISFRIDGWGSKSLQLHPEVSHLTTMHLHIGQ